MRFRRPLITALAFLASLTLTPHARSAESAETVVALPPFLVEEIGKGPSWRYAALDGFEVLSRCSDSTTRELTAAYVRLHRMLELVLPVDLQLRHALPRALIYIDEDQVPSAAAEVVEQMIQRTPGGAGAADPRALIDPPNFGGRRFSPAGPAAPPRVSFLPNLRLEDRDAMAVLVVVRAGAFDPDTLVLTPAYVAYLVRGRAPALPLWFANGFLALFKHLKFHLNEIEIERGTWISEAVTDAFKSDPQAAPLPAPLPLGEFFTYGVVGREAFTPDEARRWNAQSEFFLRWALDPNTPARRAALWKFVARASATPATEAMFQECFGIDFATAHAQLAAFLPLAINKAATLAPPQKFKEPKLALGLAAPVDIARIKGDWERLEVPYVRARLPAVAPKYLEQARRTLRRAYDHGERDPRLLTVLGLCEIDAANDAGARGYLEAAIALTPALRPRAGYELARLRLAEARAEPAGADGRINTTQVAAVLTPLFAARQQVPPLPEVYALIAEAWAACDFRATRRHLGVLDEGAAFFPRHVELVYQTAAVNLRCGFAPEAAFYVDLGKKIAPDDATRARFAELAAKLPPAPPVEPELK
ncbi:MAG: hypothetical protein RLZZ15_1199 [Verrucomicrobiota bacterium]|jgi:hypothetical protein